MSEAIGIVIKHYTFLEIEKNVLFTALSFFATVSIIKYMERFFTLELARSSSNAQYALLRSFVRSFMPMHKVLLYRSHFATLNSNVGVKLLQADCVYKEKTNNGNTNNLKLCLFYSAFLLLFVCLYPFYALSIQSI